MIVYLVVYMKKNSLTEYFNNQLSSFRKNFSNALKTQSKRDIHRLRLNIKKLRAILSLVEIASAGNFNKMDHFLMFEDIFKKAGKVRETQMNLYLIKKQRSKYLHHYRKYLFRTLEKTNHTFLKKMSAFNFKKLDRLDHKFLKYAKTLPDQTLIEKGMALLDQKYRSMEKLVKHLSKGRKLHKVRIHLKAMLEIIIALRKVNPSLQLKIIQKEIKVLNDTIGEWHDYVVLLQFLRLLKHRKLPEKEAQYLNDLITRIDLKKQSLKDHIEDRLKHRSKNQVKSYLTSNLYKVNG